MSRFGLIIGLVLIAFFVGQTPVMAEKKSRTKKSRIKKKTVKGDYVIEKRSDGTTVKYKKKNTYDFEGADISGLFKRPSGSYISNIEGVKGRSIIRIRKHFDPEVKDSTRMLR